MQLPANPAAEIDKLAAQLIEDKGDEALAFALSHACAAILAGDVEQDQHWTRIAEIIESQSKRRMKPVDWRTRPPAWQSTGY